MESGVSESPESSERILDEANEFCARKESESSDSDDFLKSKYYSDINHFGKE